VVLGAKIILCRVVQGREKIQFSYIQGKRDQLAVLLVLKNQSAYLISFNDCTMYF